MSRDVIAAIKVNTGVQKKFGTAVGKSVIALALVGGLFSGL